MTAASRLKARLPADLAAWLDLHGDDIGAAWRRCTNAHWLIHLAAAVEVDRSLLVRAAADVVSAALAAGGVADEQARRALRIARAWLEGGARSTDAWASACAAADAAEREADRRTACALRAAAFVAFACDEGAEAGFYAHRGYAAKAVEEAAGLLADPAAAVARVRACIPLAAFLEAFEIASRPPAPLPGGADPEATTDTFYFYA